MTQRPSVPSPPGSGVLIVDPEMLVRAGLRMVVESDPSLHVVDEVADGAHAIELAGRFRPALAIVSAAFRNPSGVELAAQLRIASPGSITVLLARPEDAGVLIDAFRAGVTGFVRSDVGRLELLAALHRALAGESVIDPAAATQLIVRMAAESELAGRAMPDPLTPREIEILRLVAQGQTNRQIAERLIVAVGTIKIHVEHILGKLGTADRTSAAVRAVELGIVHADETPRRNLAPPH